MPGSDMYTIVLANLMSRSGRLNRDSVERAELAIALQETSPARNIVLCGWDYRPDSSLPIAKALGCYISNARPTLSANLIYQCMSRDTVGDAFFSRLLIEAIHKDTDFMVKVVTSDYHEERAREVFRFVFPSSVSINAKGASSRGPRSDRRASERSSLEAFRNTFANVVPGNLVSIHKKLVTCHPFYNGKVHPKIESLDKISQILVTEQYQ
jgi:uncharacterized SAM-binding protein YcdF (DUF218 family)